MKHIAGLIFIGLLSLTASTSFAEDAPAATEAAPAWSVTLSDGPTLATFAAAKAEMAQKWGVDRGDAFALLTLSKYTLVTAESEPVEPVTDESRAPDDTHVTVSATDPVVARLFAAAKAHLSTMAGRELTDQEAVRRMSKLYVGVYDAEPGS